MKRSKYSILITVYQNLSAATVPIQARDPFALTQHSALCTKH